MAKYSIATKVGELLKNPEAVAILDEYLPKLSKSPQIKMAYAMTLKQVLALPQAALSKSQIAEIDQKLQALE